MVQGEAHFDVHFDVMDTSAQGEDGDETTVWTLGKVPGSEYDLKTPCGKRRKELTRGTCACRSANCGWKRRGKIRCK